MNERNVFVRNLPKDMKAADLDKVFSEFGKVKSAKISLNKNHESNGYGFVAFDEVEFTRVAIE
jgi:RNA recognition motif-containing protein